MPFTVGKRPIDCKCVYKVDDSLERLEARLVSCDQEIYSKV